MRADRPEQPGSRLRYRAHGVELVCDFPLLTPGSKPADGRPAATIAATASSPEEVRSRWSGGQVVHQTVLADGVELSVAAGQGGDHLIAYGEHRFHLAADLRALSCTPRAQPAWENALLGWVTYFVAVLAGVECLHAGAVQVGPGVVVLAAPSGAGKSTLVAELIARGGRFVCDDVLALEQREGAVRALPGSPYASLDAGRPGLAAALGRTWAQLGDELLVAVERRAEESLPIAAVVLLERHRDGPESARFEPAGMVELRGLSIGLPHLRGREAARFSLLAALAEQAPPQRLRAGATLAPAELASALEARLASGAAL